MYIDDIRSKLKHVASNHRAAVSQRYFKTGPGQYADGDVFLGISAPNLRRFALQHQFLADDLIQLLLHSSIHEERLLALLILVRSYSRGDQNKKKQIYEMYVKNTKFINNWDLVDVSAPHIVGDFLMNKDKAILYDLARSSFIWERRISVIATAHFIKKGVFSDTLKISKILLSDKE